VDVFTIGFTKKSAEKFFRLIKDSHATTLVDVRLNNISQLAGFAKRDDLAFFLGEICRVDYVHRIDLAPTQPMLDSYKKGHEPWDEYERQFLALMAHRRIAENLPKDLINNSVLLCSEDRPHHCHRRLVAEYLNGCWSEMSITHLV
jgi:uncharacterized protein (DUF488 family)